MDNSSPRETREKDKPKAMIIASYDYDAQHPDELSFTDCQMMTLVRKRMDGWWMVEIDGKTGKVWTSTSVRLYRRD